ncbi:hypothetical protein [Winogradskyella pulchriflava]|uniref:Depolymerase 2 capsule K5-specific C-terminal domain-containing protein n=1 Tax=Winogradskyella pulchriflava TaxID=1110688 RepID=A0ABV6QC86_9FLAO
MKNWNVIKANVLAFLGLAAQHDKPLELSAEEKDKLNKFASGGKEPTGDMTKFADIFAEKFNKEIDALADNSEAQQIYADFLAENGIDAAPAAADDTDDAPDAPEVPTADAKSVAEAMKTLVAENKKMAQTNAELAANVEKLKKDPEPDVPEAIITVGSKKMNTVKHSATHLFASGESYDSLDLPWNKNLVDAQKNGVIPTATTVWDKINIDKLNSELGAYARRNSNEIMDLLMDGYDIPEHWSVVSNVQDEYVFASIVSGQITQAFKKAYLPKNDQRFVPVKNKIYDKQIDGQWQSSELKSIEKSWLNMFFNEGSTPYKDSFARYLIGKLLNQARKEDKISIFKGVYSSPDVQPEKAGDFLNAMSGFLKLVSNHRGTDYQPFDTATLTSANTYDVINDVCKNKLPIDVRNTPLKLGLGSDALRWYIDGRELAKGTNTDYGRVTSHVDDMPNIEFVKHPQLEGTGFFYITTEDNIGLMVDRPGEESLITIEKDVRAINFFADYKLGVYFKAFGANVDPNVAVTYEDQIFFSNNVELLTDVYVPVAANDATPSLSEHNALKIGGNNTSATDVTNFDDATAGQYVYIYCDDATNAPTIKHNANIILASGADFTMAKGDKLTLVYTNSKFVEYSRTVASEVALETKVTLAADATTADAADGTWFVTQANTGATAFTNIANAVVGEIYTLEGGSDTDSTTVASSGNFLLSASFTASDGAILKVKYNGSKFVEVSRA